MNESLEKPKIINWKEEHERILVEWSDKAMCYRWLYSKANTLYYHRNAMFTIPVIIISTLTGTANFAQDRFDDSYKEYAILGIGAFNIIAGIISTIHQFLKISELNESHRVSSIAWGKFHRNIKVELSKSPDERMNVTNMLKIYKEEFDRLMETSPQIPESVIENFKEIFGSDKEETLTDDDINSDKYFSSYSVIHKPEICDELVSTKKFAYKNNEDKNEKYFNSITEFINDYYNLHGRKPINDEIYEHFHNKIDNKNIKNVLDILKKTNNNVNYNENDENDENENDIKIDLKEI